MVEEALETIPLNVPRPAVKAFAPMVMVPNPEPMEPEVRVPTVTRLDEPAHVESAVFSTKFSFSVALRLAVVVPFMDDVVGAYKTSPAV